MAPTTPDEVPGRVPEPEDRSSSSSKRPHGGGGDASGPLLTAVAVTGVVSVVSYVAPVGYANTLVGLVFLAATWWLVVHDRDTAFVRHFGLGLGGLTETGPLSGRRLFREGAHAGGWALVVGSLVFPLFWWGYTVWWDTGAFVPRFPRAWLDQALGQLLVVALPEEAFYRGYLQTSLEDVWANRRRRVLGVELGWGWLASAAIFAVGHLLTVPHPSRLAVFFPALMFGWLRARTGGVGAAIVLHALSNLLSAFLADAYR
ncbi:MAG: MrtC family glutamic-type intramembrane protease [Myxococcota bacterium]